MIIFSYYSAIFPFVFLFSPLSKKNASDTTRPLRMHGICEPSAYFFGTKIRIALSRNGISLTRRVILLPELLSIWSTKSCNWLLALGSHTTNEQAECEIMRNTKNPTEPCVPQKVPLNLVERNRYRKSAFNTPHTYCLLCSCDVCICTVHICAK